MSRSATLLLLPLFLYSCLFGTSASAADSPVNKTQRGRVNMSGSIVEAGCAMQVGNEGQTITFQPAALHGLVRGDASFKQPLNILLSGCGALNARGNGSSSRALKLTFEGEGNGQYFGIQGAAQGVALQIKNAGGKLITPGMILDTSALSADAVALNYFLELVGTGNSLRAGNYHATIKLSIQHF